MTLRAIRDEFCRYISCRWFDLLQNKAKVTLYVFCFENIKTNPPWSLNLQIRDHKPHIKVTQLILL